MTAPYQPIVLVDTENLSRDEWLKWRRRGIGGSDAAAVLGISPFRTARDLYYDKMGIVVDTDDTNWVAIVGAFSSAHLRKKDRLENLSTKKDVSTPAIPLDACRFGLPRGAS